MSVSTKFEAGRIVSGKQQYSYHVITNNFTKNRKMFLQHIIVYIFLINSADSWESKDIPENYPATSQHMSVDHFNNITTI